MIPSCDGYELHLPPSLGTRRHLTETSAMSGFASCTPSSSVTVGSAFTLGSLTERGAQRWPAQKALCDAQGSLTFGELHELSECLARELVTRGVQPGDRVAVFGSKALHTVVSIFAIVKTGAMYVPLDPNTPEARLTFMLEDARPLLVLGKAELGHLAADYPYLAVDTTISLEDGLPFPDVLLPQVDPADVAYMMYTSGSTGRPKGVLIEHRGIGAFFHAHNAHADIREGDICMNTGPFHFDVSIMDVFLPLYFGATVILTPELPVPTLLLRIIERYRVTHFYAVGTILALMTGDGHSLDHHDVSSLRMLQTGAEVCNPRVVNHWLSRVPNLAFINSYGPTELTVGCACYRKPSLGPVSEAAVPIGTLHDGSQARLRLADGQIAQLENAQGELLITGEQIMRGYWNRPEEDAKAFVELDGVRYYRTGDIVQADAQGQIHYIGRQDHEFKIDGVRIHLNEVKHRLEELPYVHAAAAFVIRGPKDQPRVAAALAVREPPDEEALFAALARSLPCAAIPVAILLYRELPRTSTGKTHLSACAESVQAAFTRTSRRLLWFDRESAFFPEASSLLAREYRTVRSAPASSGVV